MDIALEKALNEYPEPTGPGSKFDDANLLREVRDAYMNGYNQAKKDLTPTWEDMAKIKELFGIVLAVKGFSLSNQELCNEVLSRFLTWKLTN